MFHKKRSQINWKKLIEYYDAWWNCEILDKVPFYINAPREDCDSEGAIAGSPEDRFNKEKVIEETDRSIQNTFYGGIAFPYFRPNFGPDVFSAYLGASLKFSPMGSPPPISWVNWHEPILKDYSDLSALEIKEDNFYWQKTKEFISYALERSQGEYFVGTTDIHAGIDSLSVLRGSPETVCMDLIDNPDGVKEAMKFLWKAWHKVYAETYEIIAKNQEGTSSTLGLSSGKMYPVQNDFTCLISPSTYKEARELLIKNGWDVESQVKLVSC